MKRIKVAESGGSFFAEGYASVHISIDGKSLLSLDRLELDQRLEVRLNGEPPIDMRVSNVGDTVILAII